MKKMTKENYKKLLDQWISGDVEARKIEYVYHGTYIAYNDIVMYAFKNNIVVSIGDFEGHLNKVTFKCELS